MGSNSDNEKDKEKARKRDKIGGFLRKNLTKGEIALKHAAGLGHQPNVVPIAQPSLDGPPRAVEVGWHPVAGLAGKWFAERTGLGKMITEKINRYPDPTQHWAVLVGDYAHQLWMDENFDVIYTNEKVKREEWKTFEVGATRFNDDAVRRAGESVIQSIRDEQPGYNLVSNNCQTYVLRLLDAINVGVQKQFGTTLAVCKAIAGPQKVSDFFVQEGPEVHGQQGQITLGLEGRIAAEQGLDGPDEFRPPKRADTVIQAQHLMDQNTTQLDTQEKVRAFVEGSMQKARSSKIASWIK